MVASATSQRRGNPNKRPGPGKEGCFENVAKCRVLNNGLEVCQRGKEDSDMGLPICKNGHLIFGIYSYTADGRCKKCRSDRENKEKKRERDRLWREKNPEYGREYKRLWREKNPDYQRLWREKNPEHQRLWREKNPEHDRLWREKNKERLRSCWRSRLAKRVLNLSDDIVARYLGLKTEDIPVEIIELKRQQVILKRELKKWKE